MVDIIDFPKSRSLQWNKCFKGLKRPKFQDVLPYVSFRYRHLTEFCGTKNCKERHTTFRKSIPISERLAITLRYLASGDSFRSLSFLFNVSKQAISTGDKSTSSAPDPDFPGVASF
nr:unnamed protein product [Callosobruchus analis]CAI5827111.1 unnamed protein product [Callosobruchus analis]